VDNPSPSGNSIPAPQRIDAGFGGVATGSHQAAGVALIAAAILLSLLVVVIARRQRAEAGSSPRSPVRPPQPQVRRLGFAAPCSPRACADRLPGRRRPAT
jgi:uncharacterized membrane protein YtjA (UPF0391 family)